MSLQYKVGGMQLIDIDPSDPFAGISQAVLGWLEAQGQMLDLLNPAFAVPLLENVILPLLAGFVYSRVGEAEAVRLMAAMPTILERGLVQLKAQNQRMN